MTKLIIFLIIIIGAVILIKHLFAGKEDKKRDLSVYKRKNFLFDTVSELNLFKTLVELFGDKYHIFAQVNYSHLIEVKPMDFAEQRKYRSSIDRKSADFVLCDKERVVPQLIIELDGGVHNFKSKQARDEFIDNITNIVDLPILHIKTNNLDREFIKNEVTNKLAK
jgi:very-short-patch-repair endonuclease